eukprot:scaffold430_cov73-Skeletonema_marinoi.AAC.1
MPKRVNKIPPAGHKKRKEVVGVSANNESSPPKKRYRYECSAEGCTNHAKKGGVCSRHGAKVEAKLCSVDDCNNISRAGGVCWRHGAKLKQCSVNECTNYAKRGGLCIKHGAQLKRCSVDGCNNHIVSGGVCIRHGAKVKQCSVDDCTNIRVKGGVCIKHGAQKKRCNVDECNNQVIKGGVCWRHRTHSNIAPRVQGNVLCREVQGGGNQNYVSTVVAISDNEEEGGKKQSPISGRKRKADNVGKQSKTAASNDAEEDGPVHPTRRSTRLSTLSKPNYNLDAAYNDSGGNVDGNEEGKEATDRAPSDVRPQKRARGEVNLNDDKEQDASDVAPVKEGEGGIGVAMEDGDSCGGDDQNEYDCGEDDNGDVNSEEGKFSHVVPEEITATANDAENDSEIQRLTTEMGEANVVVTLKEQLNATSEELEAIKSRSKSEHEQTEFLRSQLNGLEGEIKKKSEIIVELEEELEAEKTEKAEMDTQLMTTAKARLEERVAKDAVTKKFDAAKLRWKTWWREQKERLLSNLNNMETQLKTKSDAVVKLKADVVKLQATKDEMQAQMQIATNNEVVLRSKVEELTKELKEVTTKFEAAESFWNSRREEKKIYAELNRTKSQLRVAVSNAKMKVMTANAKVDFAVSEVGKRDVELEQAKAENEELRRALNEERRQKRFKVKLSPRMELQDSLQRC